MHAFVGFLVQYVSYQFVMAVPSAGLVPLIACPQ